MELEDLYSECDSCNGQGEVKNPELDQSHGGTGIHVIEPKAIHCKHCNGKGIILTKTGKTLIQFIEKAKNKGLLSW